MRLAHRISLVCVVALLAASCTRITDEPQATPSSPTPGSPTSTETATGLAINAPIFFVLEQSGRLFLVPETRSLVEPSPGVGRMSELLAGEPHDKDLSSPWPSSARVLNVTIEHGTAIVDFSAEVLTASVGADMATMGIQAAVHTLTEMAGVDRVSFSVEGKTSGEASNGRRIQDWWGHTGLREQPFARGEELLAPITIDAPEEGAEVARTFTVRGEATVFEANVVLRVRDGDGAVVTTTNATASIGAPERGTWRKRLTLPNEPGSYTIEAIEESQEDGGDSFVMTRVVTLI